MRSPYGKFILFTTIIMFTRALISLLTVTTFYHQYLKAINDEKNYQPTLKTTDHIEKNTQIELIITNYIQKNEPTVIESLFSMIANTGYKLVVVEEGSEKAVYGEPFRKENLPEEAIEQVLNGSGFHGMRDFPKETFVTGFFADEMANTVGDRKSVV